MRFILSSNSLKRRHGAEKVSKHQKEYHRTFTETQRKHTVPKSDTTTWIDEAFYRQYVIVPQETEAKRVIGSSVHYFIVCI